MPRSDETPPPNKPPYAWRCSACQFANDAGVASCFQCGLAAYSRGKAIAERASELQPLLAPSPSEAKPSPWHFANDLALFFPEGILAAITVLALPIWLGRLLYNGDFAAAAVLFFLDGIGIALCIAAWREKNKWVLYAGVVFILLGAWFAIEPARARW